MPKKKNKPQPKAQPQAAAELNDEGHAPDDSAPIMPPPDETPTPTYPPQPAPEIEGENNEAISAAATQQTQFELFRKARIERAVQQLARAGVDCDYDILAERKEVRAAQDDVALDDAIGKAVIYFSQRATEVKIQGGTGRNGRVAMGGSGEINEGEDSMQIRKQPADSWKCPNCSAVNSVEYADNDNIPFEYCRVCNKKYHKHWLYANYHQNNKRSE